MRNGRLNLQAWNDRRNLVRRVTRHRTARRAENWFCAFERFGQRTGTLALVDLRRSAGENVTLEFRPPGVSRAIPAVFCAVNFQPIRSPNSPPAPIWSTASRPLIPALYLRQGASAWAAIGASPDAFHAEEYSRSASSGWITCAFESRRWRFMAWCFIFPLSAKKLRACGWLFLDPERRAIRRVRYTEEKLEEPDRSAATMAISTRVWIPIAAGLPSDLDRILAPILRNRRCGKPLSAPMAN